MKWKRKHRRAILKQFEQRLGNQLEHLQELPQRVRAQVKAERRKRSASRIATTAAWITGSVAVVAAGIYAGTEIRSRYKFNRRTPYDYYGHSGDRSDLEFGVGT